MGLDFAIDELYATGWSALDTRGCLRHADGRVIPGLARVTQEFAELGFELTLKHIQLFDCFRAEWRDASGAACGAVVGRTEPEALVYALSQVRRASAGVGAV